MSTPKERAFIGAITARPDIRLFFIFGQDESAIADIAAQMAAQLGGAERIDIDSDRIRNDPALLADEASSLSLFGDKRYVRLNFRRDEGLAAVENLLELDNGTNPVIATAGNLTKASKLRKLAESHKHAMAHICYLPEEGTAAASVMAHAATLGLKLDRSLGARIARYTGQDRKLAQAELEKLALYYDASPERPMTVEVAAFEALSAETARKMSAASSIKSWAANCAGLGANWRAPAIWASMLSASCARCSGALLCSHPCGQRSIMVPTQARW